MSAAVESRSAPVVTRVLADAPEELTRGVLRRLGEGVGKVVYASDQWVVRRKRSPREVVALILLWRGLHFIERLLPGGWGRKLRSHPSRKLRFLRVLVQGAISLLPQALWFRGHIRDVWRLYRRRDRRGVKLAQIHLTGSPLYPQTVTFPPVRVRVGGWPGWLVVSEATERVETTLNDKFIGLARAGRFLEMEQWLIRLLDARQAGWRRGLFSMDAHLKNYGAIGDRVVLLDSGGLTGVWSEVEQYLSTRDSSQPPHCRMGLEPLLRGHPEIATQFDDRWNATVNLPTVRAAWPSEKSDPARGGDDAGPQH